MLGRQSLKGDLAYGASAVRASCGHSSDEVGGGTCLRASGYQGPEFPIKWQRRGKHRVELSDLFGWVPRGRRLRATAWVVMVLPPLCKKFSEWFLQIGAFSSSLGRGRSYGRWPRVQEKMVFSCIGLF